MVARRKLARRPARHRQHGGGRVGRGLALALAAAALLASAGLIDGAAYAEQRQRTQQRARSRSRTRTRLVARPLVIDGAFGLAGKNFVRDAKVGAFRMAGPPKTDAFGLEGKRARLSHTNITLMRNTRQGLIWDPETNRAVVKDGPLFSAQHPRGIGIYALEIDGKKYNAGNVVLDNVGVGFNQSQYRNEIIGKSCVVKVDRTFANWGEFAAYVNHKLGRKKLDAQMSAFDIAYLNGLDARKDAPPARGSTIVAMGPKTVIGGPSGTVSAYNVAKLKVPANAVPIMFNPSMSNHLFDARTQDINRVFVGADKVYMTSSEPGGKGPNFGVWAVNPRFKPASEVADFQSTRAALQQRHAGKIKIVKQRRSKR